MYNPIKYILAFFFFYISTSVYANTNGYKKPELTDYDYQANGMVDGYHIDQCNVTEDGLNICNPKTFQRVKKLANNNKPTFGKNRQAVLVRLWDKKDQTWLYIAVNKTTKKVSLYHRGIRAINGDPKNISLTFDVLNGFQYICTSGQNVSLVGTQYTKSYDDDDNEYDFCTPYDEKNGFGETSSVNAKTRKVDDDFGSFY